MLWINGQISAFPTMRDLSIPSLVSLLVSTWMLTLGLSKEEDEAFEAEMKVCREPPACVCGSSPGRAAPNQPH